jgi:hypothetical protein
MTPKTRRSGICFMAIALFAALFFVLLPSAQVSARRALLGKINDGAGLKLYEGLPHPKFDAEFYKSELAAKPVMRINGSEFYEQALFTDEALESQLLEVSAAGSTYETFSGEKKCGGFHADYALRWLYRDEVVIILVCFSCDEAWLIGETLAVRTDLSSKGTKTLLELLSKTRGQRPHPEQARKK